jgi:hypothetical protein
LAWDTGELGRFLGYLLLSLVAADLNTRVPGIHASISLSFVAVLTGVAVMSLPETMLGAGIAAGARAWWSRGRRPDVLRVVFHMAVPVATSWVAYTVAHAAAPESPVLRVAAAVVPLYLFNPGASNLGEVWEQFRYSVFQRYVMGGVLAAIVVQASFVNSAWAPLLPAAALSYLMFAASPERWAI